ncbi:xanthine dehydrogenase family protein subunit M [Actinobacteria bacterium YIM 96077]|uniref:Xanthine dehydrogenase family protein subunit M n=1 Tax=Phytoactinopolyspora halophila TaxID=1981511 RepID=A0A329R2T9_9ACTN|nr:FAD binding domain-containing protein [Phytoactinopolyspora halophila]AYY11880.1 xanthine dehydrogenase family protein subunit M [Actinobacteria bacterium YIM 96077]RAW18887.1 xanthine dehydrogenase family protein subunit M [Phytoactinopolyspora halophila]
MEFLRPRTWNEAVAVKAAHPEALALAGGTDVMVELNFDRTRPASLLDLTGVDDLAHWALDGDVLRLGAGVTYSRVVDELGFALPGLATASRTVGSPQIRNRGTIAGNLGSASPAGDAHPALLAAGAEVEVESVRGVRHVPVAEFFAGPKRHVLEPDELIKAILVRPASGPQEFAKIGTRNAMVIAVCSFGLALHPHARRVGTGIGSAAATPRRALDAERFVSEELDWQGRGPLPDGVARRFGELVAHAAEPIDDGRGTARYRVHALAVMARRTLGWAWAAYRKG